MVPGFFRFKATIPMAAKDVLRLISNTCWDDMAYTEGFGPE